MTCCIEAHVLEVYRKAGRFLLKLRLVSGDVRSGDILLSPAGGEVKIVGVAFSPPEAWQQGVRLVSAIITTGAEPVVGTTLTGKSQVND